MVGDGSWMSCSGEFRSADDHVLCEEKEEKVVLTSQAQKMRRHSQEVTWGMRK